MAKGRPKGSVTTKSSSLKSINQKIRRIAKTFGTDSLVYENYVTTIDRNFPIHYTKEGIIQINTLKEPSEFQKQQMVKLSLMHGVKQKMKLAKKRLKEQGIKKPDREELINELKRYEQRQRVIDDTLDLIYDEETEGHLPSDIADIVDRMRGRVSGQGITSNDVDLMIDVMRDWKDLKARAEQISADIHSLDYIDDGVEDMIYELFNGNLTSSEYKEYVEDLEDYYNTVTEESEV